MRRAGWVVLVTVAMFFGVVTAVAYTALHYPDSHVGGAVHEEKLTLDRGMSMAEISKRLADKGLIERPTWFRFYANQRGMAQKIRAGQYTLSSSLSPRELLEKLVAGVPIEEVAVTIPEGKNLLQVAELLDQAGVCNQVEAVRLMRDPAFARQLSVPNITLEGYLFPDTYRFRPGTAAAKVLTQLVRHAFDVLA
jgi:UPF0755 protein